MMQASNASCGSDCDGKRLFRNNVSRIAADVQAGNNWLVMQRRAQAHPHRQLYMFLDAATGWDVHVISFGE